MPPNRITRGGAMPRALPVILVALALAPVVAGCGGGSSSTSAGTTAPGATGTTTGSTTAAGSSTDAAPPSPEDSPDAAILNTVLARQEAVVGAYAATIPHLAPRLVGMATYFRTQEQEHVDGVVKEMRALRIAAEPKSETIDPGEPKTDAERLLFLYEVESRTIDDELSAISKLESSSARTLLASTVANQAQHLTLLRRALGAGPQAQVPEPFENGTAEPPDT